MVAKPYPIQPLLPGQCLDNRVSREALIDLHDPRRRSDDLVGLERTSPESVLGDDVAVRAVHLLERIKLILDARHDRPGWQIEFPKLSTDLVDKLSLRSEER
jgi:hypothetical protein